MRGKVKTAMREASKLHGASAQFVSLVDAGANETPFTLIKSKDGASAMTIKKRGGKGTAVTRKSHKTVNPARKQQSTTKEVITENIIAKMVFSGEVFEDEAAVNAYLEAAEWDAEETSITKNEDGDWEVRPEGTTDDDFLKLAEVDPEEEGVSAFVGTREVKSGDDPDEDDDEEEDEDDDDDGDEPEQKSAPKSKPASAQKSDKTPPTKLSKRAAFLAKRAEQRETAKKFDAWDAYFSKENTLAKALEAGMAWDGVPPGYYEVQSAFTGVAATIVGGDMEHAAKQEALNKAALDFAEIIGGLDTFFEHYTDSDEEKVAKAFTDAQALEELSKWADNYADFASGETPQPLAKSEKVVKTAKANEGTSGGVTTETVADIIAKALDPITKQVEEVSGTIEALASRHPTKKAADAEDTGSATPRKLSKKDKDADDAASKFGKAFLG